MSVQDKRATVVDRQPAKQVETKNGKFWVCEGLIKTQEEQEIIVTFWAAQKAEIPDIGTTHSFKIYSQQKNGEWKHSITCDTKKGATVVERPDKDHIIVRQNVLSHATEIVKCSSGSGDTGDIAKAITDIAELLEAWVWREGK